MGVLYTCVVQGITEAPWPPNIHPQMRAACASVCEQDIAVTWKVSRMRSHNAGRYLPQRHQLVLQIYGNLQWCYQDTCAR